MTPKQTKTLEYAGFTDAQITALSAVFNVLPPPERRKEIDGFVSRTAEKMREIDEMPKLTSKQRSALEKIREFRIRADKTKPPTP